MEYRDTLKNLLSESIQAIVAGQEISEEMGSEFYPPEDPTHGDLSTNVAFGLAKLLRQSPQKIAERLCLLFQNHPLVEKAWSVQGFSNIILHRSVWTEALRDILIQKTHYGHGLLHEGEAVNIEYVSANPTGPLHGGHGRGAILGDVLANLLEAVGYAVTREYYVNDAGNQIQVLARSVYHHYVSLITGQEVVISEGMYPGNYVREVAKAFLQQEGDRWLAQSWDQWGSILSEFSVEYLLAEIKKDLKILGIQHDVFTSERAIHQSGLLDETLEILRTQGLLYTACPPAPLQGSESDVPSISEEATPCLLFRSTMFGDDQDRVVQKSNGEWTYFAGDMAYHLDKVRRGFKNLLDIFGADHGGHVLRTTASVQALTGGQASLQILLCQMVHFLKGGVPYKMSKREGEFVTLRDILQDVDPDAFRFFILTKKSDTHMEFDLQKIQEQAKDNPVFYVQYAHARCCSVLRAAHEFFPKEALSAEALAKVSLEKLNDEELDILKLATDWPRQVRQAADTREPHRLATFLYKLATSFHSLWQKGKSQAVLRFLQPEDRALSLARMAFLQAMAFVIASGLGIFGISPKEEM